MQRRRSHMSPRRRWQKAWPMSLRKRGTCAPPPKRARRPSATVLQRAKSGVENDDRGAADGAAPRREGCCRVSESPSGTTLFAVSKQRQQNARARAKAAREREQNARERARRNEERGDPEMARLHDHAAELHADAASDAETLIELDRQIERDQLGDD
jgi:hypothetical protein